MGQFRSRQRRDAIRVLHVDDDPQFADMAGTFLEREDDRLTVETASSASEGRELLRERTVDCVISDYDMPGENGIEFLETVREAHPDLPFVLYTGKGSEEIASEAISAGVTDYLQKGTGTDQYTVLTNRVVNAVERWRATQEAARTRTRLRAITDNSTDVILTIDDDSTIEFVNPAVQEVLGYEPSSLVGESLMTIIPERYRERHDQAIERYQRTGERTFDWRNVDFEALHRDGTEVPVSLSFGEFEEGGRTRFVGSMRDVSDRRESRRRLQTLIDNLPGIVYRCRNEPDWPFEYVRGECEALTGYEASAIESGEVVWGTDVLHPADQDEMWAVVQDALDEKEPFEVRYRILTKDGELKWMWERGRGVFDGDGQLMGIEGFITDITEQQERERELERVRDRMQVALDVTDAMVWDWNVDEDTASFYPSEENLYGSTVETWEDFIELVHPNDREMVREGIEQSLETGETKSEEIRILDGDDVRWIEAPGKPIEDEDGTQRMVGIVRDVTERKAREQDLKEERAINRVALDSIVDFYWVLDLDGYVVDWSDTDGSVTGYTAEDAVGMHATDFFPPEEREYIADRVETLLEDEEVTARADFRTASGTLVPYRFDGTVIRDEDGEVERMCGFAQDVSEQVAHERELEAQNERLERFASIVSHDLRNPLHVAGGNLELAMQDCESEHLTDVQASLDRMNELVDDLLSLAREGEGETELEPVVLETVTEQCWRNVETADADLEVEAQERILAETGRLQQLFENLIRNAIEHGGADVTVTVGTLEDGFYVADDGEGIPSEVREDVFEPGYTTSEGGTGFGLSIVQAVADAHGWEVSVSTSDAGGARFEIRNVDEID